MTTPGTPIAAGVIPAAPDPELQRVVSLLLATQQELIDLRYRRDRENRVLEGVVGFTEVVRPANDKQAFWEAVIGVLLLIGAGVLVASNSFRQITEIYIFAGVLVLQSLPFLAAVMIAILENSRINSFEWWRSPGVRTAELIGLRPVALPGAIPAPIAAPQPGDFVSMSTRSLSPMSARLLPPPSSIT